MTKGLGNDKDHRIFFGGGEGGQIIANLLSKIMYHKQSLSVKRFQNGFRIVINLLGETVWKECLH